MRDSHVANELEEGEQYPPPSYLPVEYDYRDSLGYLYTGEHELDRRVPVSRT